MEYYCELDPEYNKCPYFHDNRKCTAIDTKCAYRRGSEERPVIKEPYIRKERWYGKYYK